MKGKKVVATLLSSLLLLSGCGDKETKVEDYGNDSSQTTTDDSLKEALEGEPGKLSEKLGGESLEYTGTFNIGGRTANVELSYQVPDADSLPAYKASSVQESEFKEDEIVKNIFGDSAVSLNFSDRDELKEENDDSSLIISFNQMVAYKNDGNYEIRASSCPTWVDEDTFYAHNYEGTYNGATYQLMLSYSKKYNEINVALFPKKISDVAEDPSLDSVNSTLPDGNLYVYYKNKPMSFNILEVMSDRPNKCTKSDAELTKTASESMKDMLGIAYPDDAISFYYNNMGVEKTVGDQNKCEAVFYNDDALLDSNLEGAVRDGYVAAAMAEIEGIRVLKNPEFSDLKADVGITEMVIVNNSGIMGLALSADYNLNEKITDNVKIISFQEAMDSFVEVTDENVDKTLIKNQTGDLNFNYVDLCYFPVSTSDSKDDVTFLPVWVLEARDKSRSPILRVLINATDGSFVGAYY